MQIVNLVALARKNLAVKGTSECCIWEINCDYLTNEKSKFTPLSKVNCEQGDFLLVKSQEDEFIKIESNAIITPFYLGVIDSFEDDTIVTCDFYNVLNFDFAATRKSGGGTSPNSAEYHLARLIFKYYALDNSKVCKNIDINVPVGEGTAFSYLPKEPPTVTNLNKYFVHFFKKYNITYEIKSIIYNQQDENELHIETFVRKKTKHIQLKNNVYDFVNWSVYEEPAGAEGENMLLILDKATIDSENPVVLSTWYIKPDSTLTQNYSDGVRLPTRHKVYIYDTEQKDAPTYLEVAQSELSSNRYSHEINFDIKKDNNMISVDELEIGLLVDIVYNDTIYSSVLTGFLINSNSDFITLRFGNIRSTFEDVLDEI